MKKLNFSVLSVLLFCLAGMNIYGQRREISKQNYSSVRQTADERAKNLSYRRTSETTISHWKAKKPFETRREIYERQSSGQTRYFLEAKNVETGAVETSETIETGGYRYKRLNDSEWTSEYLHGVQGLPIFDREMGAVKYLMTRNAKLNNQTTNLYEKIIKAKIRMIAPKGNTVRGRYAEKRWISSDNLLLKVEFEGNIEEYFSFPSPKANTKHRVSVYEYDPNIKIEAPIMGAPAAKP